MFTRDICCVKIILAEVVGTLGKRINLITIIILIALLCGCNNQPQNQVDSNKVSSEVKTLSYWMPRRNMGDTHFAKALQRKTGVNLEFIGPDGDDYVQQLMLLKASNKLPDIIENDWKVYTGGPEKAITDEMIIRLNDMLAQYAPNLTKYLDEHPDLDRDLRTDQGSYYAFPFIRGDDSLAVYRGIIIRQDWLDKYGLKMPETISEWENTLRVFKQNGVEYPLTLDKSFFEEGAFIGAYGINSVFFQQNGIVKFGPLEDGYFDFLSTFARWYKEGLIDVNFATNNTNNSDRNILTGKSGAFIHGAGGGMGNIIKKMSDNKEFKLSGAPYPSLNKGELSKLGQYHTFDGIAAVSPACKDIPLAVKFLDYGYSKEGMMFYNFGVEGETYNIIDGKPIYTDLIVNNPNHSMMEIMYDYIRGHSSGPFIQMKECISQYYTLPEQREAVERWVKTDVKKYRLPDITFVDSEISVISDVMPDIKNYKDNMLVRFIMGIESLENFEEYRSKLRALGVDRAIEVYQEAYNRYLKR